MSISITNTSCPASEKNAIVLCCDTKYLPYAALAVHTIVRHNPDRAFDICIVSLEQLTMPPVLEKYNVRLCKMNVGDSLDDLPTSERFTIAAYLRLALPEAFVDEYDRILYMDCDVFAVGEALDSVFDLELYGMPVGAVSDNMKWKYPGRASPDQKNLEINGPYFNSGVLLMDCKTYVKQHIRQDCIDIANQHDHEKLYFDQTLLNLALKDRWACLHPAWNWQWAVVRPLFELFYDVQLIHFISISKPWADPRGSMPIRYRETARRFFEKYYPELAADVGPPATHYKKRKMFARLFKHITRANAFVNLFNQNGGDITNVLPPSKLPH